MDRICDCQYVLQPGLSNIPYLNNFTRDHARYLFVAILSALPYILDASRLLAI